MIEKPEVLESKGWGSIHQLRLRAPGVAETAAAGQFVYLRCGDGLVPLMRRPLSLNQIDPRKGEIGLLFAVKGMGTRALASRSPGEALDLMGPLGRGFPLPEKAVSKCLLVGGGIGSAPLLALARSLAEKEASLTVILGAATEQGLVQLPEFQALGKVLVTTDDGSAGRKGLATDWLETAFQEKPEQVYTCGPLAMMARVCREAAQRKIPCHASLENIMGCGVGACYGCVAKVKAPGGGQQYVRVCREGPVFPGEEVCWDEWPRMP